MEDVEILELDNQQDEADVEEIVDNLTLFDDDLSQEANHGAYTEIFEKIKNDKYLLKRVTVKGLVDFFSKKPYGWRDYDILGLIANLYSLRAATAIVNRDNIQPIYGL